MIKILTGYSNVGGSTTALAALCNLFNDNKMPCELYGPTDWVKSKLNGNYYKPLNSAQFNKEDTVIYHFLGVTQRLEVKKLILSCHETNVFPIKEVKPAYDALHFVSKFQKDWQGVDGVVIPNVITKYKKSQKRTTNKVAGIVGSIDPHKQTHLSIKRALEDKNISKIELWGQITTFEYFWNEVYPLLNENISYHGASKDMQKVYDRLDVVFSSSLRECLPMIQAECHLAGVEFRGLPENTRSLEDYIFDDQEILNKWKELLS
jgi:hypothetical protein